MRLGNLKKVWRRVWEINKEKCRCARLASVGRRTTARPGGQGAKWLFWNPAAAGTLVEPVIGQGCSSATLIPQHNQPDKWVNSSHPITPHKVLS